MNLYPVAALDGHVGFPPTKTGGRRKSEGRKEGENKKEGEVCWEEVQGRQRSYTDMDAQAEQLSHTRVTCPVQLPSFQVRRGCSD